VREEVAVDVNVDDALVVIVVVNDDFVQALKRPERLFSMMSFMYATPASQLSPSANLIKPRKQSTVYVWPGNLVISLITDVNALAMSLHLLPCESAYKPASCVQPILGSA